MVRWGFCLPTDCTNGDLKNYLEEKYSVKALVDTNMCQRVNIRKERSTGYYIAR